jgi:hypothetical protein
MMLRVMGNKNLNCRTAPQRLVKKGIKTNDKIDQEKQPPTRKSFTHTMLQCCVPRPYGKAQKTAIYAPRQISRRRSKAHLCCAAAYSLPLEPFYFNSLPSRLIDRYPMKRGR